MHSFALLGSLSFALALVSGVALPAPQEEKRADNAFGGFQHPNHLPDGSYSAYVAANGTIIYTPIGKSGLQTRDPASLDSLFAPRASCQPYGNAAGGVQIQCENNNVDSLTWFTLRQEALAICGSAQGQSVHATRAIYSTYNGAQMYFCNYAHTIVQSCSTDELSRALGDIGCECPNYDGGWEFLSGWYKKYGFTAGGNFCADNTCNGAGCYNTKD